MMVYVGPPVLCRTGRGGGVAVGPPVGGEAEAGEEGEEDRVGQADPPPLPLGQDGGKSHGSRIVHAPVRIVYIQLV